MQPLILTLEPGGRCGEHPYTSVQGEEFAIVLRGSILFEEGDAADELVPAMRCIQSASAAQLGVTITTRSPRS